MTVSCLPSNMSAASLPPSVPPLRRRSGQALEQRRNAIEEEKEEEEEGAACFLRTATHDLAAVAAFSIVMRYSSS